MLPFSFVFFTPFSPFFLSFFFLSVFGTVVLWAKPLRVVRLLQASKPRIRSEIFGRPFRLTEQRWSMAERQPFEAMLRGVSPAGRPTPSMLHSQLSTTVGDARCLPYRLSMTHVVLPYRLSMTHVVCHIFFR
jgi:hypothetical protein